MYVNVLTQANFEEGLVLLLAPTYIRFVIVVRFWVFSNVIIFEYKHFDEGLVSGCGCDCVIVSCLF